MLPKGHQLPRFDPVTGKRIYDQQEIYRRQAQNAGNKPIPLSMEHVQMRDLEMKKALKEAWEEAMQTQIEKEIQKFLDGVHETKLYVGFAKSITAYHGDDDKDKHTEISIWKRNTKSKKTNFNFYSLGIKGKDKHKKKNREATKAWLRWSVDKNALTIYNENPHFGKHNRLIIWWNGTQKLNLKIRTNLIKEKVEEGHCFVIDKHKKAKYYVWASVSPHNKNVAKVMVSKE